MDKYPKMKIIVLLILPLAVIGCGIWWHFHQTLPIPDPNLDENASDWNGVQEQRKEKLDSDNIEIPCFEKLVFSASETKQQVNLYNPESNSCYMVISLVLEDETLWESEMIEPNKGFYSIELNHALEVGHYTAYFLYHCYSLEDLSEYNSAKVAVNLVVQ